MHEKKAMIRRYEKDRWRMDAIYITKDNIESIPDSIRHWEDGYNFIVRSSDCNSDNLIDYSLALFKEFPDGRLACKMVIGDWVTRRSGGDVFSITNDEIMSWKRIK